MSGNPPPFVDFLEEHRALVYRFLLVAVGPQEADDCFQETFLSALRAYPGLRDARHLDRWVLRIASRKALDHHRSRRRLPVPSADLAAELAAGSASGTDDELWSRVAELPPRQRVAVVHRYVLDRPYSEIAEAMGGTEEAARANVSQGVRKLRELMT